MSDYDSDGSYYSSDEEDLKNKKRNGGGAEGTTTANTNEKRRPEDIFDFSDGEGDGDDDNKGSAHARKRSRTEKGRAGTRKGKGGLVGDDESSSDSEAEYAAKKGDGDDDEDASAAAAVPSYHALLAQLVGLLNIDEDVSEAYSRLTEAAAKEEEGEAAPAAPSASASPAAPTAKAKKALIHSITRDFVTVYNASLFGKSRDEVVDMYYATHTANASATTANTAANTAGGATTSISFSCPPPSEPLPPLYALEWEHRKGSSFGPFTAAQMKAWQEKKTFEMKKAKARNINAATAKGRLWEDANVIAF